MKKCSMCKRPLHVCSCRMIRKGGIGEIVTDMLARDVSKLMNECKLGDKEGIYLRMTELKEDLDNYGAHVRPFIYNAYSSAYNILLKDLRECKKHGVKE